MNPRVFFVLVAFVIVLSSVSSVVRADLPQYSTEEVAAHKSRTSLWTIVNGYVYDLTAWQSQHPGGPTTLLSIGGKDGTKAFLNMHSHSHHAQGALESFKIGVHAHKAEL